MDIDDGGEAGSGEGLSWRVPGGDWVVRAYLRVEIEASAGSGTGVLIF